MRRPWFPSTLALSAALAVALLAALAPAASAAESPLDQYQRTGKIDPCNPGLGGGGGTPNDVAQYAPDYIQALNDAKAKGCNHGGGGGGGATGVAAIAGGGPTGGPPGAAPGTPYVPKPPAPPKTGPGAVHPAIGGHLPLAVKTDGATPAPVIALAVMLLLALLGGALAAVGRQLGWSLGVLDPVRHAGGEAAMRMGSAAGSLTDWARDRARRDG
jgi:hypothetical protein